MIAPTLAYNHHLLFFFLWFFGFFEDTADLSSSYKTITKQKVDFQKAEKQNKGTVIYSFKNLVVHKFKVKAVFYSLTNFEPPFSI